MSNLKLLYKLFFCYCYKKEKCKPLSPSIFILINNSFIFSWDQAQAFFSVLKQIEITINFVYCIHISFLFLSVFYVLIYVYIFYCMYFCIQIVIHISYFSFIIISTYFLDYI